MILLYILIGIIIGSLGIFLYYRPQLLKTQQYNIKIAEENKKLQIEHDDLCHKISETKVFFERYLHQIDDLRQEKISILNQINSLKDNIASLKETQQQAAKYYYDQALTIFEQSYDKEIDKIYYELERNREDAKNILLKTTEEAVEDFEEEIKDKQQALQQLTQQLQEKQNDVQIAIAAAQRKLEIENKQDYYRVCLSAEDIIEIKRLREILPYLRDKTPLNKVIYKIYYEKPTTDMINRVIGNKTITGIYKITNLQNQMCYVGQAVNIADRWKQHIKRGVGAEDWTQNKLYPVMYAIGVENFSFEIIEECDRSKLNEREDYWQEYFHAKDFGYSIK